MIIRKISVGNDYKSSMHYLTGQDVLSGNYKIHLIEFSIETSSYKIWVESKDEIFLWKEFNSNMPLSVEYNMTF